MATSTVEDYVKAIYLLQSESPTGEATVARIAATVGVTKGTVTAMVRKLRDTGLADAERYGGITLTDKGDALAIDMIRRHRLIEVFLVDILGLDWAEVHDEAERLEHAMSKKVLDRLDAFLGHPAEDPHGDPIPDRQGRLTEPSLTPLASLEAGESGTIGRVSDQDSQFLAFAAAHGLRPGNGFAVLTRSREADSMTVHATGHDPIGLSLGVAVRVLVNRT